MSNFGKEQRKEWVKVKSSILSDILATSQASFNLKHSNSKVFQDQTSSCKFFSFVMKLKTSVLKSKTLRFEKCCVLIVNKILKKALFELKLHDYRRFLNKNRSQLIFPHFSTFHSSEWTFAWSDEFGHAFFKHITNAQVTALQIQCFGQLICWELWKLRCCIIKRVWENIKQMTASQGTSGMTKWPSEKADNDDWNNSSMIPNNHFQCSVSSDVFRDHKCSKPLVEDESHQLKFLLSQTMCPKEHNNIINCHLWHTGIQQFILACCWKCFPDHNNQSFESNISDMFVEYCVCVVNRQHKVSVWYLCCSSNVLKILVSLVLFWEWTHEKYWIFGWIFWSWKWAHNLKLNLVKFESSWMVQIST